jgi:hypothetical protein
MFVTVMQAADLRYGDHLSDLVQEPPGYRIGGQVQKR